MFAARTSATIAIMKTGSLPESFRRLGVLFAVSWYIEKATTDSVMIGQMRFAKEKNVFYVAYVKEKADGTVIYFPLRLRPSFADPDTGLLSSKGMVAVSCFLSRVHELRNHQTPWLLTGVPSPRPKTIPDVSKIPWLSLVLGGALLPMLGVSLYRAARGLWGAAPAGSAPGSPPDVASAP